MSSTASRSNSFLLQSTALAGMMIAVTAPAQAQTIGANELPTGGHVSHGSANFQQNGSQLDIHQNTNRVVIEWNSFNIGKNARTQFNQPNASSIAVNRIHDVNPSQILGSLGANGQVVLLNTNGVVFGAGSTVDVSGLVVSTGNIDTDAFMTKGAINLMDINHNQQAKIENSGHITIQNQGLAAFVAPHVVNNGVIEANLGKIALASGADKATVDLYGDGLVELTLDDKASKALIDNNGTLKANGGKIAITAKAASDAVNSVINMDGLVEANYASEKGGVITLSATNADIKVAGKLNAKGGKGNVNVRTNKNIDVTQTAVVDVSADQHGDGGVANIIADEKTLFNGVLLARGGAVSGNGGMAEISGYQALGFHGYTNLGAANGHVGSLLLDPQFAIIHNGPVDLFGYVINAQALANSMESTNVTVQADQFIDVGARDSYGNWILNLIAGVILDRGDVDVSTYNYSRLNTNGWPWQWYMQNFTGTTAGSLTLQSDVVNFNRNLTLGTGGLSVDANTVNLGARIYDHNGVLLTGSKITSNANLVNVLSNAATIQQGVHLANIGAAVNVAADTYHENVVIDKALTLDGDSAQPLATYIDGAGIGGHGITIAADDVNLRYLVVKNFTTGDGIRVDNAISNVFMRNVNAQNNKNGINITANGSVDGFKTANVRLTGNDIGFSAIGTMRNLGYHNGLIGNNRIGFYSEASQTNAALNVFDNILISGTKFVDNISKGIYVEKLSNAEFRNIEIRRSGTGPADEVANAGIDINLKYADYANIAFNNINVNGSGTDGATRLGISVAIKARNDGAYAAQAASLTGVRLNGGSITTTGDVALSIGNNVSDIIVSDMTIDGKKGVIAYGGVQGLTVENTIITSANSVGVGVYDARNLSLNNNMITGANIGIEVTDINDADIRGNTLDMISSRGIRVATGRDVTIADNTLDNVRAEAIWANTVRSGLNVSGNKIGQAVGSTIGQNAIWVNNSANANISDNTISAGLRGIVVLSSRFAQIVDNVIEKTREVGIKFNNTGVTVDGNSISNATGQGIVAENATDAVISNNVVADVTAEGITSTAGTNIAITDNMLTNIGGHGIWATNALSTEISGNTLHTVNGRGIRVETGRDVTIADNTLDNMRSEAIWANTVRSGLNVSGNKIGQAVGSTIGQNAIWVNNSANANISDNTISAGLRGIVVLSSRFAQIMDNVIEKTREVGIKFNNTGVTVDGNSISNATGQGIVAENATDAMISNNTISAVTGNGITLLDTDLVTVSDNIINDNDAYGLYVSSQNGSLVLTNNVINSLANGVGARFDAGQVDLTGAANTFNGGENAMIFGSNDVSLVGNAFGSTVFNGQNGYYIALENGAFFNGTAEILDARQVDFDGYIAGNFTITEAEHQNLMSRLYHNPNDATLGWIYFDYPAPVAPAFAVNNIANYQDILPEQSIGSIARIAPGSVTVAGLPYSRIQARSAASLAAIAPAAGENMSPAALNHIATAAGGATGNDNVASAVFDPSELNNIETAAGSEKPAECWTQVYSKLSQNGAVAVTFNLDDTDGLLQRSGDAGDQCDI